MRVRTNISEGRLHFMEEARPCSGSEQCAWRERAYIVPGDVVFVGPENAGYRCAYYGTAKGDIMAGFLPTDALETVPDDGVLDANFLEGTWTMLGVNSITFTRSGEGAIHARGDAQWHGRPGVVHYGSFSAASEFAGGSARFRQDSCEVTVHRRGPYLVVLDNGQCGGMNVRFRGIYVRRTTTATAAPRR